MKQINIDAKDVWIPDIYLYNKWVGFVKEKKYMDNAFALYVRRQEITTESARSSSNKWTKNLYQDYLHCIANFCRALLNIFSKQFIPSNKKRRKRMLNYVWNTWKFWLNETDDEIVHLFPQNVVSFKKM